MPTPELTCLINKFIPEAQGLDGLLLRRGQGREPKAHSPFSWVRDGVAHSMHFRFQRDSASVSQSTWESW